MLAKVIAKQSVIAVFAIFSLSTLTNRALARPLDPISPVETAAREARLSYVPWNGQAVESGVEVGSSCTTSKLQVPVIDPFTGLAWQVTVDVYKPTSKSISVAKVPVVLVVPTMDGVTIVEPKVASQLCEAGMGAVIADVIDTTIPETMPSWGLEDAHARSAILALRTLLDVVQASPSFDRDRVGVIGISLGAIMTSMFAALEPERLKAVVITLAGGNLPYILSVSDNKKVVELRDKRMEATGISTETEYEDALRDSLLFDPLYFASPVIKNHLMMITAKSDTKVPYEMQQQLFSAFGQPTLSEYSGGHVETILQLAYYYFDDVSTFFKSEFGMTVKGQRLPKVTFH